MRYDINKAALLISVRELCERALIEQEPDLRALSHSHRTGDAAIGAEVHRKLQSEAGAEYRPEQSLSLTLLYHNVCFEISGRADGLLMSDPPTVDEIKTVSSKAFELPPAPLHDAQVKCYAYMLCRLQELDAISTRLTYYCRDDGRTRYLTTLHTREELQEFVFSLLLRVEPRARILIDRETTRLPTAEAARFPYPALRTGQEEMIRECYRDIKAGKRLFAELPTGTGKTISALYPAVRALGERIVDKIFYLTAKATTRKEAYRAAALMFQKGVKLRTLVLSSREQVCICESAKADPFGISRHCNPIDCPYAKGYFDRSPAAVASALNAQNGFDRGSVLALASKAQICPYEFQLELSELCDLIVCDYNYVFDPQVYLRRYFSSDAPERGRFVFLIDEAHNLFDRACSMYSAGLDNLALGNVYRLLADGKLKNALEKLGITMRGFRRLCKDTLQKDEEGHETGYYLNRRPMESFYPLVSEARAAAEEHLRKAPSAPEANEVFALATLLKRFERIAEYYDDGFLTFILLEDDVITLRLICLDPSRILDACHARALSSILFSATLTPTDYFADILGGTKKAVRISLPSPYDPQNCCVAAVTGISTRYEDRAKGYKRLAGLIAASVCGQKGNYIVFFPSYEYLEKTATIFRERYPNVDTVLQTRGMSPDERERFLSSFADDGRLRVGFCVLGGSFSEGVDLPGRRLIGVVIVGTGLPGISNERNILRDYYDVTRERGFDYAYTYPALNRVLQAAGRVIRQETDKGVIVLIDDRYAEPSLRALLPAHWKNLQYAGNASELAEIVRDFWS